MRAVAWPIVAACAVFACGACGSDATPPPPPVAAVAVTPAALRIEPSATTVVAATLTDAHGNVLTDRIVTWASSDVTIASVDASSGTVRGLREGTATITATSETQSGSAELTVAVEPAGMTRVSSSTFDCLGTDHCPGGWDYTQFGNGSVTTIVTDPTAPKSPPQVARVKFPAGLVGGAGVGQVSRVLGRFATLYISAWVKFSANWVGNPTGNNKIFYLFMDGQIALITEATGSGSDRLHHSNFLLYLGAPYHWYPDPFGIPYSTVFPSLEANVADVEIVRGQWHHYEYVLNVGTPGTANGSFTAWVDGRKTHDFGNIMWRPAGSEGRFGTLQWEPIWGGNLGPLLTEQYQYMDHIYISGK